MEFSRLALTISKLGVVATGLVPLCEGRPQKFLKKGEHGAFETCYR